MGTTTFNDGTVFANHALTAVTTNTAKLVASVSPSTSEHTLSSFVTLSAAASVDPDVLPASASTGLTFAWTCQQKYASSACPGALLPADLTQPTTAFASGGACFALPPPLSVGALATTRSAAVAATSPTTPPPEADPRFPGALLGAS